jgi:hypothetical protein
MDEPTHDGGCLCGAVRYRARGPLRAVVVCHCGQCRRTHGGAAPYTAVSFDRLTILRADGLAWYASSATAERGFCRICGASLLWRPTDGSRIGIAAGSLDGAPTLPLAGHVDMEGRPDWDVLPPGGLAFPAADDGALTRLPG